MAKALQPSICICRVIAIRYNRIDSHFSNVIRYYVILYHSIQQKILFICSSLKQSTIPTIEFVKTCISLIVLHPYNRSFDISNNMILSLNIFYTGTFISLLLMIVTENKKRLLFCVSTTKPLSSTMTFNGSF